MADVFISYARESGEIVRDLANDLRALGYEPWFDEELSGGQAWWDEILKTIRDHEIFIFVLDSESLGSIACERECGYASDLGKPILPVLVSGDVDKSLLPPALAKIHFIDYRDQNREALRQLAKSLRSLPAFGALPKTLPDPPDVPVSYIGSISEKVRTDNNLSVEEQASVLFELRGVIRDSETTEKGIMLVKEMRARRDLFATVADEIDEILNSSVYLDSKEEATPSTKDDSEVDTEQSKIKISLRERILVSIIAGILGTFIGGLALAIDENIPYFGVLFGAGAAIAGAISGKRIFVISSALIFSVIGFFVFAFLTAVSDREFYSASINIGSSIGIVVGSLVGVIIWKQRTSSVPNL